MNLYSIYEKLHWRFGPPSGQWSFWCQRPKTAEEKEIVIIESILTQRARWENVQLAVKKMQAGGLLKLEKLLQSSDKELLPAIRPSGFYNIKLQRLRDVARFFLDEKGGVANADNTSTATLREELLLLKGIGPETADDIILYAFHRPVFVVDEYTRRLLKALKLTDKNSYASIQAFFQDNLPADYGLYQDFHALIVISGKTSGSSWNLLKNCGEMNT